jgi:APA family basic amino acid/polyamine antiporter
MLGVGVFVTTGPVALHQSGPSVFISYIIAGISALLSSLCYTEFAVQVPVAGGAFSYLRLTFGKKNHLTLLFKINLCYLTHVGVR